MEHTPKIARTDSRSGVFAGITAYTIWGLFPIYFVVTKIVPAPEILAHRVVWAVPFGLLIILARKQLPDVKRAMLHAKTVGLLALAALALSINWGVYIWAVQNEHIFQGSLGYYINPLMYVLVGVVFLGEKLSRLQGTAALLAALGVLVLTIYGGVFPGIALILAISFTLYGVIRSLVDVGAMPGLFVETLVLLPVGLAYMYWLQKTGSFGFAAADTNLKFLLMLAGPITVLPLLAFAFAARRLKLSTLGFLQYIGPTMQFGCALYYGEAFTPAHAICFTLIWIAVGLFSWDAWKRNHPRPT